MGLIALPALPVVCDAKFYIKQIDKYLSRHFQSFLFMRSAYYVQQSHCGLDYLLGVAECGETNEYTVQIT